jgi:hypothetical protein
MGSRNSIGSLPSVLDAATAPTVFERDIASSVFRVMFSVARLYLRSVFVCELFLFAK